MIPLAHAPRRPDASVAGASPELAEVVPGIRGSTIRLPPELARATVQELLRREQLSATAPMVPRLGGACRSCAGSTPRAGDRAGCPAARSSNTHRCLLR